MDARLDWLVVGATVAYVNGRRDRVYPAHVDKVGKRDVFVTAYGRVEKFNINHTQAGLLGETTWLYRRGGTWDPSTYLAPVDDPAVTEIGERQMRDGAAARVMKRAEAFGKSRDVATAGQLREAIDAFLELADGGHSQT